MQDKVFFQIDGIFQFPTMENMPEQTKNHVCIEQCRQVLRDYFGAVISIEITECQNALQMNAQCPINAMDLVIAPFESMAEELKQSIQAIHARRMVVESLVVSFCANV